MTFDGAPVDLGSLSNAQLQHLLEASREAGRDGLIAAAEAEVRARRLHTGPSEPPAFFDDAYPDLDAVKHDDSAPGERQRAEALREWPPGTTGAAQAAAPPNLAAVVDPAPGTSRGAEAPADGQHDPYNLRLHRETSTASGGFASRWVDSTGRVIGEAPVQSGGVAEANDSSGRLSRRPAQGGRHRLAVLGGVVAAALAALIAAPWLLGGPRGAAPPEPAISSPAPERTAGREADPAPVIPPSSPSSPDEEKPRAAMARPVRELRGEVVAALPEVREPSPSPRSAPSIARNKSGPAFHCDWRLRPSEQLVCSDAELSGLDRRLNQAFSRAVAAGVPRAPLRAEQDAWVWRRERAAQQSRQAVEDLYRERIQTLTEMAEEARSPDDQPS